VLGAKTIDAKTPVSIQAIVVVLQVSVSIAMLVRFVKANEPVVGVVYNHLVVTVNHVVTDPAVIVPVMV